MEDFGILWIWGFCGDSHRFFCGYGMGMDIKIQSPRQSNGCNKCYSNTVIGTLAADVWTVTFVTARRGQGGLGTLPVQGPSWMYQCNSPPINGPCTNFILFDVAV